MILETQQAIDQIRTSEKHLRVLRQEHTFLFHTRDPSVAIAYHERTLQQLRKGTHPLTSGMNSEEIQECFIAAREKGVSSQKRKTTPNEEHAPATKHFNR